MDGPVKHKSQQAVSSTTRIEEEGDGESN